MTETEILEKRIKELEAKISHLEDDCEDGCVYCKEYIAFSLGVSDLAPGIVSPKTKLTVIEAPRDAMGSDQKERMRITASGHIFFKRGDGSVFTIGATGEQESI